MPAEKPIQPTAASENQHSSADCNQGAAVGCHILRVESNLLGLPFFALQKRGRNKRKYIEVNGVKWMPDGSRRDFRYKVARNSDRKYPGLLSRKIHYALLDHLQQPERGLRHPAV